MLPASRHKGMLSIEPQRPHRHPLRRTPGAGGTKDNSVLWPGVCRACHAHCFAAGCPDPGPPPATQCARQSLPASFTPPPSLRFLVQFGGVAAHQPHMLALAVPSFSTSLHANIDYHYPTRLPGAADRRPPTSYMCSNPNTPSWLQSIQNSGRLLGCLRLLFTLVTFALGHVLFVLQQAASTSLHKPPAIILSTADGLVYALFLAGAISMLLGTIEILAGVHYTRLSYWRRLPWWLRLSLAAFAVAVSTSVIWVVVTKLTMPAGEP